MSTVRLPEDYYEPPRRPRPRLNWKRIAGITVGFVVVPILIGFVTLFALLHNTSFRQYIIRVAHQQISDRLGLDIGVRDFGIHLSGLNPTVDMYGATIAGAAPYTEKPLAEVERLSASIRIDSFLRQEWYFSNIELERPIARVFVDAQGNNNFPRIKTSSTEGQTDIFDLGVRHVLLKDGQVYYNDRKSAIDADVQDFQFESNFTPADKRYSGKLSYHDGNLRIENFNPVVHSLEAAFQATPSQFKIDQALLSSGSSRVTLVATLDDYASPRVQADYQGTLDTADLRRIMNDSSLPLGVIKTGGSARYRTESNQPLLNSVAIDGNLASDAIQLQMSSSKIRVSNISGRYALENGNLNVQDVRAGLLGGGLTGAVTVRDVAGAADAKLTAAVRGIGLTALQSLMNSPLPRDVSLTGQANAKVNASWKKSLENLIAHTDADLNGTIKPTATGSTATFPLNGEIHAQYNGTNGQISFNQSYVRMPQTSVNLNGTVSDRSSLEVRFQSNDLREVETLVDAFHPMEPLGLAGVATFNGTVRGSATDPQIVGQLRAAPLDVKGTELRMFQADVEANPSKLTVQSAQLQLARQGQLNFDASVGLTKWSYSETSPIELNLKASRFDASDLANLAGKPVPVSGTITADVSLHGSQLSPMGQGTVSLTQARVYDEPIDSASVNFQGTGDELRTRFDLRLAAGAAQGNLTLLPKQRGYDVQLHIPGLRLDQLHTLAARNVQVAGTLSLNATGAGTFSDPALDLNAQIPRLQVQNQTFEGITLKAAIAKQVADFALNTQSAYTYVRSHGKVNLTGAYDVDAVLDTSKISLQPLIATYMPSQANNLTAETEVHAQVRGPLNDKSLLDAHITIPTLGLNFQNRVNLAAANPIQLDYAKGVLTLQRATIRGTGTDLQLQGTIPVTGTAPPSIVALGTIDLQLAQLVSPDVSSSGQIKFNVNGSGRGANPDIQGQIQIVNANFAAGDAPLGLQNGNGVLRLTNSRLEIARFQGNVGSGTLTATGGVTYRPSIQFNVTTVARGIRTLIPQGVRETLSTNLTLTGNTDAAVLRGQVQLEQLSFSPDFDLAEMLGQFSGATTAPAQGFAKNLRLDVAVQSTNDVNLVSSKLSLQGAANLQVRGSAAEPVIVGRLNLNSGDLIFRGNRYVIQPSSIDFVNPVKTEPVLNADIQSTVHEYEIHMRLRGPVDHLRTTYTSDPSLPPADIINLLVFGKTTEAAEANPVPGNLGAESLIASSVSNQITNRVEKAAGISQLSVDPVLGDSGKSPGARVTLQQRVTGNLFVTFSTDVTGTQHEVIKLQYDVSPKVSLTGARDQNGGLAVEVRRKKTW